MGKFDWWDSDRSRAPNTFAINEPKTTKGDQMFIYRKKVLQFLSKTWFWGNELFYVSRIPQTDFLQLVHGENNYHRYPGVTVTIADFIMVNPTNKTRSMAAEFVFSLQWQDNICIRTAYELDKIQSDPEYSKSRVLDGNSLRIVNGEVWTRADYEVENQTPDTIETVRGDQTFESYPELDYGVTVLPPFVSPQNRVLTRLECGGWNSTPESILVQLRSKKWQSLPSWNHLKDSEMITRM